MRRRHLRYALVATGVLLLPYHAAEPQSASAQPSSTVNSPVHNPAPQPALLPDSQGLIDTIRYEREALERQAERQTQAILTLATTAAGVLSFILAVAIGLFVWMFGSTRRELRESLQEFAREQLRPLIDAEAQRVRQQLARVEADIESLRAKRRPVTWIVRNEADANNELVTLLQSRSVDVSAVLPVEGQSFAVGNPELVILSYEPTEEGNERLRNLVHQLRDRTPQVPVVVYTFDPVRKANRLLAADEQILDEYRWYVPANFPLQLVTHVTSLLSGFRTERRA